jgi:hypothetical protein
MSAAHHHRAGFGPGPGDERLDQRVAVFDQTLAGGLELEPRPVSTTSLLVSPRWR